MLTHPTHERRKPTSRLRSERVTLLPYALRRGWDAELSSGCVINHSNN